jgi:phage terminase small subunit
MKGRKPKPTALKDLHGSRKPRNPDEPKPVGELTVMGGPPSHFNDDQRELWAYALEHAPYGMLKRIDAMALEVWVMAMATHRVAAMQLHRGLVIAAPNTRLPIQSPYLSILNRQAIIMLRASEQLGFTPVSRPRINASDGAGGGESLNAGTDGRQDGSIASYLRNAPKATSVH